MAPTELWKHAIGPSTGRAAGRHRRRWGCGSAVSALRRAAAREPGPLRRPRGLARPAAGWADDPPSLRPALASRRRGTGRQAGPAPAAAGGRILRSARPHRRPDPRRRGVTGRAGVHRDAAPAARGVQLSRQSGLLAVRLSRTARPAGRRGHESARAVAPRHGPVDRLRSQGPSQRTLVAARGAQRCGRAPRRTAGPGRAAAGQRLSARDGEWDRPVGRGGG